MMKENTKSSPAPGDSRHDLTQGSIFTKLLQFAIPLMLSQLLQQAYNTADLLIVANLSDDLATAAIGATTPINFMLVGFFMGFATGATVLVAQAYGAKSPEKVFHAVHTSYATAIVSGLCLAILSIVFVPSILKSMHTDPAIFDEACQYLIILAVGAPVLLVFNTGTGILRAAGDTNTPLKYLALSSVLNIVLDLLFVGLGGLRAAGAAYATIIAQTTTALLVTIKLMHSQDYYRLSLRDIRFYKQETRRIIRIGVPAGIQASLISFSNILIQARVNTFGVPAVTAVSISNRLNGFKVVGVNAFMTTATTFTGQNYGARKIDRLVRGAVLNCLLGTAYSLFISFVIWGFAPELISLFSQDAEVIAIGVKKIFYLTHLHFVFMIAQILAGVMRGVGKSVIPMAVSIFSIVGVRSIWNYRAPAYLAQVPQWKDFAHSIELVFASYPISWVITFVLMLIYFLSRAWLPEDLKTLWQEQKVARKAS